MNLRKSWLKDSTHFIYRYGPTYNTFMVKLLSLKVYFRKHPHVKIISLNFWRVLWKNQWYSSNVWVNWKLTQKRNYYKQSIGNLISLLFFSFILKISLKIIYLSYRIFCTRDLRLHNLWNREGVLFIWSRGNNQIYKPVQLFWR